MAKEMISLRMETEQLTEIDKAAAEMGMNRTEYILYAADLMNQFDKKVFYKMVQKYAAGLKTNESTVIQNMFIKDMAGQEAKRLVWGSSRGILDQYPTIQDDNGPRMMTGEELYKHLLESYKVTEQRKKAEHDERFK